MPMFNNGAIIETIDFDSFMQVFGGDVKQDTYNRNAVIFKRSIFGVSFIPEIFGKCFKVYDNNFEQFQYESARYGTQIDTKVVVQTLDDDHDLYIIAQFMEKNYFISHFMTDKSISKVKYKKCAVCGGVSPVRYMIQAKNKKYICADCVRNQCYSTRNNNSHNKPTNAGLTFGFELECVPIKGRESTANILAEYPDFIPTDDASLPAGGVEFKSPIFLSLKGAQKVFSVFDNNVDFSSEYCGQHIHVGHQNYNRYCRRAVLDNHLALFNPLADYMLEHEEDTIRLCGRYFGNYREYTESHAGHHSWLNLSNTNTIEFRISKFVAPKQYYYLANMWGEMMNKIVDFGNRNPDTCSMIEEARKTSEKLVAIFKKYAAGEAFCQKAVQKEKERV